MDFQELFRIIWERPVYQRLFLAFTLGLFLSCAVKAAGAETPRASVVPTRPAVHLAAPLLPSSSLAVPIAPTDTR